MRKQPRKEPQKQPSRPNPIPGNKPFTKGDSRIKPGPGRPPNRWLDLFKGYEDDAVHVLGRAVRQGLKTKGEVPASAINAADKVLDRLHGRPKTPVELMEVDLSGLSDEELAVFKQLLRKAFGAAAVTVRENH